MNVDTDIDDVAGIAGIIALFGAAFGWLWKELTGRRHTNATSAASEQAADASLAAEVVAPLLGRITAAPAGLTLHETEVSAWIDGGPGLAIAETEVTLWIQENMVFRRRPLILG